jgi:hypothetical protein
MMTAEQFAEELAHLILRATPWLPAKVMLEILEDEATAQQGEVIKADFESGAHEKRPED